MTRPDRWMGDPDPGVMARIVRLHLLASEQLEEVAAAHGIAFTDYLVLGVIRRSPDETSAPSTVCEVLRRTSGGMTLTLDRLQRSGWLERAPDPNDRRRVLLRLTETGRALAIAVNQALHTWEDSLVDGQDTAPMLDAIDDLLVLLDRDDRATLVR